MRDNSECSASALGAGSVQCRLLFFSQQRGEIGSCGVEKGAAQGQCLAAVAVGKQPKMPDLYETCRQHVEQETADELGRIESHDAASVVVPGIAPAEADLSVLKASPRPDRLFFTWRSHREMHVSQD
jgi:hypothetical protein